MPFEWRIPLMRALLRYPAECFIAVVSLFLLAWFQFSLYISTLFRFLGLTFRKGLYLCLFITILSAVLFPWILNLVVIPLLLLFIVFFAFHERYLIGSRFMRSIIRRRLLAVFGILCTGFYLWMAILFFNLVLNDQTFLNGYPFESYIAHILRHKIESPSAAFLPPDTLYSPSEVAGFCRKFMDGDFLNTNLVISATNYNSQKEMFILL